MECFLLSFLIISCFLFILLSSDADISLDMGVICCSSPEKMESSVFETPTKNPIISLESTPPPKKNKVQK